MAAAAVLLAGCAGKPRKAFDSGNPDRLARLSDFTLSLSERDFEGAAAMLAPADRARLLGAEGEVRQEFKDRLRAMRLSTLVANPFVTLERGRISGIHHLLPAIRHGEPGPGDGVAAGHAPERAWEDEPGREELRAATSAFFRSVRAGDYHRAVRMLAPGERHLYLREDGKVKESARRRLSAIDTSGWAALALEAGKLTGVGLILPSRPPEPGPSDFH